MDNLTDVLTFSRSDEVAPNPPEPTPDPIAAMTKALSNAIEGVRSDARDSAIEAVHAFARQVEAARSRKAPIEPKPEDSGDHNRAVFGVVRHASDPLYRRMERGRTPDEITEFRSARNHGMDALAKEWATAIEFGNVGERVRLYHEMNERWLKSMGISRASLLEGLPTGDNPLSAGSGAELLPLPMANQLIQERDKASKFRPLVNIFPMSAQVSRIPIMPTAAASARLENAAYTDNTPTADSALLTAKDIGVMFSAGRNFLEDSAFNIVNQLTVIAGGAIGAKEDSMICTATGNAGEFTQGLTAATVTDIAETTANTIGFVDVVAVYFAVPEQYRSNACWFAGSSVLSQLTRLLDLNGRPVFLSGLDAPRAINDQDPNAVGTILGHRVYDVPLPATTPTANLFFGDPMWYALGNRTGIRVDTDRVVSTGNRQWVIDERADGRVIPTSAVGTNASWRKLVY
jgi:HK97 family phage major capsid protein